MSEEQLKSFIKTKVQGDTSLQRKLSEAEDSDAVILIAKAAGFSINAQDLKLGKVNLSDAELEAASGGTGSWCHCPPSQEAGC